MVTALVKKYQKHKKYEWNVEELLKPLVSRRANAFIFFKSFTERIDIRKAHQQSGFSN